MSYRNQLYPELSFGGISAYDGALRFYTRVRALTTESSIVLDVGCGRGADRELATGFAADVQSLRGKVKKVIGIDVGDDGHSNSGLDEFRKFEGTRWPVEDSSVDVAVSNWTLEHLKDVDPFFLEAARVLKPGGYICLRTPNRFHYSSVGAALIPPQYHHQVRKALGHFHEEGDVFPVYYRCNSVGECRRKLKCHGFESFVYRHRGFSHLSERSYFAGYIGKLIESLSPRIFWHEIHSFGRKIQ